MQASRRTTDASRVCFSLALARIGERLGCPPPRRETAALVAGFYWFRQLYQAHCGHPMSIQGCTLQVTSRQRKSLPEASWSLTGSGWRSKNARNVTPSPTDTETFPHLSMMPDYEQRLDRDDEIQPSRQLQGLSPHPGLVPIQLSVTDLVPWVSSDWEPGLGASRRIPMLPTLDLSVTQWFGLMYAVRSRGTHVW